MKKIILLTLAFILIIPVTAYASPRFDNVLADKINEYGVFSGKRGVIYAEERVFEKVPSLLIAYADESALKFEVYGSSDGIQLTDSIVFPLGVTYKTAVVRKNGEDYIMRTSGNEKKFFTLINDAFTSSAPVEYDSITYIASCEDGNIISHISSKNVLNSLNNLKQRTISSYPFTNKVNTVSAEETEKIKKVLTSCADVTSFDIKNYDYDTLFKYILYTHKNFQILTDIPAGTGSSSSFGYNNVTLVRSDYIDYIMQNIFRITPEKPPLNNLLNHGFCYNDGYYYYSGGFDAYFATEVLDLIGIYDIGGGVTFVVFSDIYYENNDKTSEYSFAVLQRTDGGYSLLRLGMGENLPTAEEVRSYSPFSTYNNADWRLTDTKTENKGIRFSDSLLPLLFVIFSVGTVGLICGIVALIKQRRR